jgi:hypothetical protein
VTRYLYYYTHTAEPFAVAAARLSGDPGRWLPEPATPEVGGWVVDLVAEGALPSLIARRRALVQTFATQLVTAGHLVVPVTWQATTAERWFPTFDGDLEVSELAGDGCKIALVGTYTPPLGVVGDTSNRLAGHHVAEACARRFVLDVTARVTTASDAPV